ncbi:MAG: hypothetical protein AAGJ10_11265 [Bacteroidota bacterium]
MASVGYGTFEACLSSESGIVQRTMLSVSGIRHAVDLAMRELMETHYLGLRTEHQFDAAFRKGAIVLNRRKIDLKDLRKRALRRYYEDVISPALRNTWQDEDFDRSGTLLLAGGGALYTDLYECFLEEFDGVLDVHVVDDALTLASAGYCARSASLAGASGSVPVGLDIGNAQTVVSLQDQAETDSW